MFRAHHQASPQERDCPAVFLRCSAEFRQPRRLVHIILLDLCPPVCAFLRACPCPCASVGTFPPLACFPSVPSFITGHSCRASSAAPSVRSVILQASNVHLACLTCPGRAKDMLCRSHGSLQLVLLLCAEPATSPRLCGCSAKVPVHAALSESV
ncbi:hypothetical protein BCV70DRAFT_14828 [Testicularia cyperi]|uniref:Uncharacterized protein n=1 Tax=Testicularia cyperi TaxID=1882483 RepID=A0A317XZG7_9BASI|nr:hypothetical protein BCV70DRAFT_14828 [Testicularia cyperi]